MSVHADDGRVQVSIVRRHAGAVRRGGRALPVLRGAHAAAVQPVRHAALPAPRAAHAAAAELPALPVPGARALLPAAATRRLQPLPAAVGRATHTAPRTRPRHHACFRLKLTLIKM